MKSNILKIYNELLDLMFKRIQEEDKIQTEIRQMEKEYRIRYEQLEQCPIESYEKEEKEVNSYYFIAKEFLEDHGEALPTESGGATSGVLQVDIPRLNRLWKEMDSAGNLLSSRIEKAKQLFNTCNGYKRIIADHRQNGMVNRDRQLSQIKDEGELKVQAKRTDLNQLEQTYSRKLDFSNYKEAFQELDSSVQTVSDDHIAGGDVLDSSSLIPFGYRTLPLENSLKDMLSEHTVFCVRENNLIIPLFTEPINLQMTVRIKDAKLQRTELGIQSLIMQLIRRVETERLNIYYADTELWSGRKLGILEELTSDRMFRGIAKSKEDLDGFLNVLLEIGRKNEESYSSTKEYADENTYLVVIYHLSTSFSDDIMRKIRMLQGNARYFNISCIIVERKKQSPGREQDSEYSQNYVIDTESNQCLRQGEMFGFEWLNPVTQITEEYKRILAQRSLVEKKVFDYADYIEQSQKVIHRGEARTNYKVAIGIDEQNHMITIPIINDGFAVYLSGAAGSGKSTLLHMIIMEIIRNYHPDDVELWLIDYNMKEFVSYLDADIPHVKVVSLDSTPKSIYQMLEKLYMIMNSRYADLADMKRADLKEVDISDYFPRITVIIDEFRVLSDAVADQEEYKSILAQLLQRGRAAGFNFIFCNQTFTSGIRGLTDPGKKQIQTRLAMRNAMDVNEVYETLALKSMDKSDRVKYLIDTLHIHEVMYKREPLDENESSVVERYKTIKVEDDTKNHVIDQIMSQYSASEYYDTDRIDQYVDKHPLKLDGRKELPAKEGFAEVKRSMPGNKVKWEDGYRNSEYALYFGRPCGFELSHPVFLYDNKDDNMLLLSRNSEMNGNLLLSIIQSIQLHEDLDGISKGEIKIWTYSRNKVYQAIRLYLPEYVRVLDNAEDIFHDMKNCILKSTKGVYGKELIILLGYQNLLEDIEERNNSEITDGGNMPPAGYSLLMIMNDKQKELDKKEEELNRITQSEASVTAAAFPAVSYTEQPKLTIEKMNNQLAELLSKGSKQGIHMITVIEHISEYKAMERNIRELFGHRVSTKISKDDSMEFYGNTSFGFRLEDKMVGYRNPNGEYYEFYSYLHIQEENYSMRGGRNVWL